MRTVHGKIEGPYIIEEDLAVHGMITAGATVRRSSMLLLHGMITGNLQVEAGAKAIINGSVNGIVINAGGRAEVYGTVDAVADMSPEATTTIDPGARGKGRR